mmetsp:Transcript_45238/g.94153  ORF Transcript_45238/g.94153 Transcript_45238/m.94153 type:complete len:359 (-) Transcript_45238:73-1149(-)
MMLVALALLPVLAASISLRGPIDVGAIKARGTATGPAMEALKPGQYELSKPASSSGLTESNALLDGAPKEIPLFETGKAPGELPGDAGPNVLFQNDPTDKCAGGDQSGYSILNVSDPTIVPFIVPMDAEGRRQAAVIVAPGGGNRFLSWTKEGTHAAKWLNSIGISAFVLKYRVPTNTFETGIKPLIDSQRALSFVRHHAREYGLNKKQIGFMGFSAGAMLTGSVAEITDRMYDPIDLAESENFRPDFALEIYGFGPVGHPEEAPPTFIAIAKDDPCIPQKDAVDYFEKLYEKSAAPLHEVHVFSGGKHGYGDCSLYVNGNELQPVCAWTLNAQLFMEKLFGIDRPLETHAMTLPPVP